MSNHPAGSKVATATYRVLGPLLSRIVPPWRPARVVPEGFCSLSDAWKAALLNGAAWGLPTGLGRVPGHRMIAERVGAAAQAGVIRCAGMDAATGELVWLPQAAWRTTPIYGTGVLPAKRAAIRGRLLPLTGSSGAVVDPLVALRDLALLLGAADPPPPPPPHVLGVIAEPGADARSRRRDHDGDPAPGPASAAANVRGRAAEAGGDPWHEEDGPSLFSREHPGACGLGVFGDTGSISAGPTGAAEPVGTGNEGVSDAPYALWDEASSEATLPPSMTASSPSADTAAGTGAAARATGGGARRDARESQGAGGDPGAQVTDPAPAGARSGSAAACDAIAAGTGAPEGGDAVASAGEASDSQPGACGDEGALLPDGAVGFRRIGRPSSSPSVLAEFDRMAKEGRLPELMADLFPHLEKWLKATHPGGRQMKAKTIDNCLRHYRHEEMEALYPRAPDEVQRHGIPRRRGVAPD